MKQTIPFLLALMALLGACGSAKNNARLTASLDSLLEANYRADAPGAALLIAVDGNIIYDRGIGVADMETGEKIDGNTNFNIASISKQFTVVGLLRLQERGLVNVDDPVAKYYPEYRGDIWKKVTLRHLMSHSSGVPDTRPRDDREWMLRATDDESMEYFHDLDSLKFEPGTDYDYINPTFQLIYGIIQKRGGMEFEQYQQQNVFGPAAMTNVRYFKADRHIPHMAHGYIVNDGSDSGENDNGTTKQRDVTTHDFVDGSGTHWAECDYGEETFFATRADGGIYTSTHDLLNWEMALRDNKVMKEESKKLAYKPHTQVSGSTWCTYQNRPYTHYGLGWFVDRTPGQREKIYHTGDNGGFQAYLAKWENGRVVVAMLENRNDHDRWAMQLEIERLLRAHGILR